MTTPDQHPADALESLALQAHGVEADAAQAGAEIPGQEPPPAGPTNEQIISGALEGAREVFCGFTKLTSPRQTLHDGAVAQLAGVWSRVLDKRGIDLGRYMGDYAFEVAAVFATLHIGVAVYAGVQAEVRAADRAAQDRDAMPAGDVIDAAG